MGIKLDISVETPLSDDDRDILAGISVMVLAIANRQNLVDQPHMQQEEDILEEQGRSDPLPHERGRPRRSPRVPAHRLRQHDDELGIAGSMDEPEPPGLTPQTSVKLRLPETVGRLHGVYEIWRL